MLNVFESKGLFIDLDVKNKCQELMTRDWKNLLHSKPKLRTYVAFKSDFEVEPYVYTCTYSARKNI